MTAPRFSIIVLAATAITVLPITIPRSKTICRERDSREHIARIFSATGAFAAFLCWDTVFYNGNDKLGVSFQTDNGELPQAYIQPAVFIVQNQFLIKQFTYPVRYLYKVALFTVANLPHPGRKYHWI